MKRNIILICGLIALMALSAFVTFITVKAGAKQLHRVYTGYLVCQSCAAGPGLAADGVDVLKHPEKHSVKCLKNPVCIASGYGMFLKGGNNSYTYFKFDKKGSDLAYNNIISHTVKSDHLLVEVTGQMNHGLLEINHIVQKDE